MMMTDEESKRMPRPKTGISTFSLSRFGAASVLAGSGSGRAFPSCLFNIHFNNDDDF